MKKTYSSIPETLKHISNVKKGIRLLCNELKERGSKHDKSKTKKPELEFFDKYTPMLKKLKYGSKEYTESLAALKPALDHHYAANRHHPECHKDSIGGMNLVDIIEMFCDWYAASKRTKDGNMSKSIDISCKRFGVNDQLRRIFENSVSLLEG